MKIGMISWYLRSIGCFWTLCENWLPLFLMTTSVEIVSFISSAQRKNQANITKRGFVWKESRKNIYIWLKAKIKTTGYFITLKVKEKIYCARFFVSNWLRASKDGDVTTDSLDGDVTSWLRASIDDQKTSDCKTII